jgi:hypothetical protein
MGRWDNKVESMVERAGGAEWRSFRLHRTLRWVMELICVETGGRLGENVLADEVSVANSPKGLKVGQQVEHRG